jgi:hypothetical protein
MVCSWRSVEIITITLGVSVFLWLYCDCLAGSIVKL